MNGYEQALQGRPGLRDLVLEELSMKGPSDPEEEKKKKKKKGAAKEQPEREHARRGPRILDKYKRYLKVIGIDIASRSELWEEFGNLIALRNVIVHRNSLLNLEREEAQGAVNTGFKILEYCMSELLKKKERNS